MLAALGESGLTSVVVCRVSVGDASVYFKILACSHLSSLIYTQVAARAAVYPPSFAHAQLHSTQTCVRV